MTLDLTSLLKATLDAGASDLHLATAVGEVPSVLEHGRAGRLVEPGDFEGLRDALRGLMRSEAERGRLGSALQETVQRTFDPEAALDIITRTYQGVDTCGNTVTCTQVITVDDTTAPVLSDVDVDLSLFNDEATVSWTSGSVFSS